MKNSIIYIGETAGKICSTDSEQDALDWLNANNSGMSFKKDKYPHEKCMHGDNKTHYFFKRIS